MAGHQPQQPQATKGDGHASDKAEDYGVPQPPTIEKKWKFKKVQMLGVPVIFLIPLLALLGVFGESSETVTQTGNTFSVAVTYPTRYRYKMLQPLTVNVENISAQAVPTVTVSFDQDYISQFSTVSFTPSVSQVTNDAYYVQLSDVQPGEVRLVLVEMQAEQYWRHEGTVGVAAGDVQEPEDVAVAVSTLVYP